MFLEQSYEFSIFESSSGRRRAGRLRDKGWPGVSARWALSVRLSADSFVGTVVATDADKTEINFRISFRLQSGNGSSNFLIRSYQLGTGNYSGRLSLDPDTTMDYDTLQQKSFYLVVVAENTATDIARNASVPVVVHVLDVNDESPSIVPTSQTVTVSENGTQQGLVYTVSASDPDTNHSLVIEELQVTCLKDSTSAGDVCWDWFVLLPNGSLLVNSSEIDFELCDTVRLTLRAEDLYTEKGDRYSKNGTGSTRWHRGREGGGSCSSCPPRGAGPAWRRRGERPRGVSNAFGVLAGTLTINIKDINDNAPVFLPISGTFGEQQGWDAAPVPCCPAPSWGRAASGAGSGPGSLCPSLCLSSTVVVPEVSPVDLQVATVRVRSCVCAPGELGLPVPTAGTGRAVPMGAPAPLCPRRPRMSTRGSEEPSLSPSSKWCSWRRMGTNGPWRTSSRW